jgi:hypothetical protein
MLSERLDRLPRHAQVVDDALGAQIRALVAFQGVDQAHRRARRAVGALRIADVGAKLLGQVRFDLLDLPSGLRFGQTELGRHGAGPPVHDGAGRGFGERVVVVDRPLQPLAHAP